VPHHAKHKGQVAVVKIKFWINAILGNATEHVPDETLFSINKVAHKQYLA
jgi:hypothetical protein